MALVGMKALLEQAQKERRGVGAFSVGNMEMIKGAVKAAEEMNTPVILQIAEVRLAHSPLHLMGPMMVQAAKEAKVDVAVHLDHGLTMETMRRALELGFTSVMYDGSACPFEENIRRTREAAELAKSFGATVEAELGLVGGSEDGGQEGRGGEDAVTGFGVRIRRTLLSSAGRRESMLWQLRSETHTEIILWHQGLPLMCWMRFIRSWEGFPWYSTEGAVLRMRTFVLPSQKES